MSVLRVEEDFYDLTMAYLEHAATDGVVHVEVFYDPQGHTRRGIPFSTATDGIVAALADAPEKLGITSLLILCILRHLPEDDGFVTFRQAEPYIADRRIAGLGLDSTEKDNPPVKFRRLFAAAREAGLKLVAHAGEEGPAAYVADAVDLLEVDRIDHGNRALEDPALVRRLAERGMTLTVCPLSNLRLCGVADLEQHPLKRMLDAGLKATVNSDDPAYFGGYLLDNFVAVAEALKLGQSDLVTLVRNSIEGSFLDEPARKAHLDRIDRTIAARRSDRELDLDRRIDAAIPSDCWRCALQEIDTRADPHAGAAITLDSSCAGVTQLDLRGMGSSDSTSITTMRWLRVRRESGASASLQAEDRCRVNPMATSTMTFDFHTAE